MNPNNFYTVSENKVVLGNSFHKDKAKDIANPPPKHEDFEDEYSDDSLATLIAAGFFTLIIFVILVATFELAKFLFENKDLAVYLATGK